MRACVDRALGRRKEANGDNAAGTIDPCLKKGKDEFRGDCLR